MTPMEQDKELHSKSYKLAQEYLIRDNLDSFVDLIQNNLTLEEALQLITADRKRVALGARIDELNKANSLYVRNYKQEVTDNDGNVYVNDSHSYISRYEVQERIAELKAQQEEV